MPYLGAMYHKLQQLQLKSEEVRKGLSEAANKEFSVNTERALIQFYKQRKNKIHYRFRLTTLREHSGVDSESDMILSPSSLSAKDFKAASLPDF